MNNNFQTPSPMVKGEDFNEDDDMGMVPFSTESTPAVVDPLALLATPGHQADASSPADFNSPAPEDSPEPNDGKKPTKKRKSWGQVLPEPKTNLPPRKRAKTEDEKEQRRVERVLRNRRAAQSSRERKRQETEALAQRNKELEEALLALTERNARLEHELKKVKPELGGISSSRDSLTLSQPLFSATAPENGAAKDVAQMSQATLDLINDLLNNSNRDTPKTVNLASISPALSPVAEEPALEPIVEEPEPAAPQAAQVPQAATNSTTRSTQYSAVSTAGGDEFGFWAGNMAAAEPGSELFSNVPDVLGFGDIPSPATDDLDFDHQPSDENLAFLEFFNHTAWNDGDGATADQQPQQEDLAPQAPTEASNLQPTAGASASGCDARGTAVEAH